MTQAEAGRGEQYEVALSFAGEDREYVDSVARYLRGDGISTFYDAFEEAELWGKDLYVHLDEVYRKASKICVMFISAAYAKKLWTNHERRSVQARDFIENNEGNVLPARFDDTDIPGLRPTIGYIDLRRKSAYEFAQLIGSKVRGRRAQEFRQALASAIKRASEYLAPQPLSRSDSVAEEIRSALAKVGYHPTVELLTPYFESEKPEERVVGYIAYQISPFMWAGREFYSALEREVSFAERARETRPLWQLLVAVAFFATVTNPEELQFLQFDLRPLISRIDVRKDLDPTGECKEKMRGLVETYRWMRGEQW